MLMVMARAGAFSSSDALPVLAEYGTPSYEEFAERTAWLLYNAATARMKAQSPGRQVDGFKAPAACASNLRSTSWQTASICLPSDSN